MRNGLYERLITRDVAAALAAIDGSLVGSAPVDANSAALEIGRLIAEHVRRALRALPEEADGAERARATNRVIDLLRELSPDSGIDDGDHLDAPLRRLLALLEPVAQPQRPQSPVRPTIPLSTSDLLANGHHDLNMASQLPLEIASADRVDLLCSFLKWSGLRLVKDELRDLCARRGSTALRVITTAYMMATERRALDHLRDLGAEVRVSYDTTVTRLHAKAWLLQRESGYSTAYIGSSNLSRAAMTEGAEWNVRLSAIDNGPILDKFRATFEQYWNDPQYRPYDPDEFDAAVTASKRAQLAPYLLFDVVPRPHQAEILEDLAGERAHGHHRNLVVAATGTGKTVVAALDYKRLRDALPSSKLLFVAHRREILEQSLQMFRVVLRDGAFGETFVAGARPDRWTHVFASIQSMNAEQLAKIPRDHFDVVIVDEFHHAASRTYADLLNHLQPAVLLGLTATPERTDGRSALEWFDGRIASELRLWKALDQSLLSPFQYFGIGGAPNTTGVRWSRGRYDLGALSNLYTGDRVFAMRVVQEVAARVTDVSTMRALGFCVDVAHARFMAAIFNAAGINSAAISAESSNEERARALAELRSGDLRCIFSVDLFNEGVDIPDVDTVLFLRPTESATVFLQQLGRGLRRSERKECLTVLDFIGDANRRFRFDLRYRAIVGGTRRGVAHDIERGFPNLPSGCVMRLDRQAQETVLANIRRQLDAGLNGIVEDVRSVLAKHGSAVSLRTFLDEAELELEDVYTNGRSWTSLRRRAGATFENGGSDDEQVERALSRMLHLDDSMRLEGFAEFLRRPTPPPADDTNAIQRNLFVLLGNARRPFSDMSAVWTELWKSPLRDELQELLTLLADRTRRVTHELPSRVQSLPLQVHATYTLDEILTAVDERTTKGGVKRIQTGVYYVERLNTDLLFVTLEKSESDYSPTTLYNDYAISPTRFHWETQSNCHAGTTTGQRYLRASRTSDNNVLLFVRERRKDERGETMPYVLLGLAYCDRSSGSRPMQIEWELERAMPAVMFQDAKIAAG